MATFYLDPVNGNDATVAPLGWWSVAYTGGTTQAPVANEQVQGATSGKTAKLTVVVAPTSGSWAAGTAAGTMYFYGKSGSFVSEQVDCAGGGHFHITADLSVCAWLSGTSGALAARTAPGDTIRVLKSADPVSIGDAVWTDGSNFVTIAAGLCVEIDNCDSNWTNDHGTGAILGYNSEADVNQGSAAMKCTADATPGAGERQVWRNIADRDLSAGYQYLNFWCTVPASGIAADNWKICFYDDDLGTNIVDTFKIPAMTQYQASMRLAREGGGNISSTIRAIGLHVGSTPPAGGSTLKIDALFVSQTGGPDLHTLISKNGNAQGGSDEWYSIASVMGTTLQLKGFGRIDGWKKYGTDGTSPDTVETFIREPHDKKVGGPTSSDFTVNEGGADGNWISYEGGWDNATNEQNGESFFIGRPLNTTDYSQTGFGFNAKTFVRLTHFHCFCFGSYGIQGNAARIIIDHCGAGGGMTWAFSINSYNGIINIDYATMCGYPFATGGNYNDVNIERVIGCTYQVVYAAATSSSFNKFRIGLIARSVGFFTGGNLFETEFTYVKSWNCTTPLLLMHNGNVRINKLIYNEASLVSFIGNSYSNSRAYINQKTGGDNLPTILFDCGYVAKQAATAGGTGYEWKVYITNTVSSINYPFNLIIARILCDANSNVVIKAFFKKSHNTNAGASLMCRGLQIAGVDDDVEDICPSDTSRNELEITIHPTEIGVVEIEALVWCNGSSSDNVIIDGTITVTQS